MTKQNTRPLIIPIFLPHSGCPHQCVFCNQRQITGSTENFFLIENLHKQIDRFLDFRKDHHTCVEIAFYGGNFLGLSCEKIEFLLTIADAYIQKGKIDSIRFSTRPDTITADTMNLIKDFSVRTIELGVQSMNDHVLLRSNRGHTAEDTVQAVKTVKEYNYIIGLQMMVGLPGDTEETAILTGQQIVELCPDFVRIYPAVVLSASPLAQLFKNGQYEPLSLDTCVAIVKQLYQLFRTNNIAVIRMGLQASEDLDDGSTILAGPYHPAFGHMVLSEIFLDNARSTLKDKHIDGGHISIHVHPKDISKMRGLNNRNIDQLKEEFNILSLNIAGDDSLRPDQIEIVR